MNMPRRHGAPWSEQEESQLRSMVANKYNVKMMASQLERLDSAIVIRLEKLRMYDACGNLVADPQPKEKFVNFNHLITLLQKGYTTSTRSSTPTR